MKWATLAVNSAYSSSIGDSPFYLYHHRDPDYAQIRPSTVSKKPLQFTEDQLARRRAVYDIVKQRLIESSEASIRYRDKNVKENKIAMDDRVFIKKIRNQKGHNKLTEKFKGPYRIISQKSPTVFRLRDLKNGKESEVHTELIKIVKQRHMSLEETPEAGNPFPESDREVTPSSSQQNEDSQDTNSPEAPGQDISDAELMEDLDIPGSQQDVEVETIHPYRLRKRPNVQK